MPAEKTVIKLNNIPHGFYERQMKDFFSQFGQVRNVVLIRSKKTFKSRGFGFVEFTLASVAKAAAEAMHNYLFFNQVLKCRQMDRKDLPKNLFKKNYTGLNSVEQNKKRENVQERNSKKLLQHHRKILKTQQFLEGLGIELKCYVINKPTQK